MLVSVLVQFVAFVATCVANPGQCPPNKGNIGGACVEQCSSDSDCLSYQKCCSNGCGHSCVGIIRPRIAHRPRLQCPAVDVDGDSVGVCVEQCSTDGECEAGEMCCSNGCGHACVTAVETPAKPGQCPVMEVGRTDSAGNCSNDCGSDGDCQGDLKCCIIGCSYICVEPARGDMNGTKSGLCPVEHGFGICSESCSVDGDCPGGMKCCSNGCGHVCVDPNRNTELGTCPEVVSGQMGTCSEDCSSDGECPGQQRCCSNGCGHSCTNTTRPVKQGECPVVPEDVGSNCSEECSSDGECPSQQRCCSNGCGHSCTNTTRPVKQGECPVVQEGVGGICSEECSSDGECPGQQRCCSNGCGHSCTDTARPVKQGECPVAQEGVGGICSEDCSSDVECPGQQRCCSNGCGHSCTDTARPAKQGECPVVPEEVGGICSEECSLDGECPDQLRCCSNGCGHSCTDTARPVKQGECPMVPEGVGGICSEDCSSDMDCDGPAKCCSNGCGHACMEPVEVAAPEPGGQCPAVPDGAELGICSEECSSDVDCERAQRCCSNGCGHKCMDTTTPVITHDFGCRQGENLYRHEESVPADEDCQSCRCIDGGVICMVRDPCKQQGLFSKALVMPIILSASGVLISLVLMIVIVRCFLLRKTPKRSSYKLMHEVSEFERIPGASNGKVL